MATDLVECVRFALLPTEALEFARPSMGLFV